MDERAHWINDMNLRNVLRSILIATALAGMSAAPSSKAAFLLAFTFDDLTETLHVSSSDSNALIQIGGGLNDEQARVQSSLIQTVPLTGVEAVFLDPGAVPDPLGLTPASDAVSVSTNLVTGVRSIDFLSDTEDLPFLSVNCNVPAFAVCITETGVLQDVGGILFGPGSGIVVQVRSDIEPVPEPATLALLGLGLAGLGFSRRRKLN